MTMLNKWDFFLQRRHRKWSRLSNHLSKKDNVAMTDIMSNWMWNVRGKRKHYVPLEGNMAIPLIIRRGK